jgi:predicted outer membrane repeat protein
MRFSVAVLTALATVCATPTASPAASSYDASRGRLSESGVRTVGDGSKASCTSAAVVRAVRRGGVIRFACGPEPVTIEMRRTAKVVNTSRRVVIDGGGLVTLSGMGKRRILYQNTCDPKQTWTTSHCDNQASPRLVVRNLTFARGNATGQKYDGGGGGAVFARGGRLKIVNTTFVGNRCDRRGPDLGGAAVRVLDQYRDRAVDVVGSTFTGGRCSNGGAISSIGVSWRVQDSTFVGNRAIGRGANPARPGTRGGGSGGAIYLDGNRFTLSLVGTTVRNNLAKEGGGAIFFVSNDRTGTMRIRGSRLVHNPSRGFETRGLPGIFFLGARRPTIIDSVLR